MDYTIRPILAGEVGLLQDFLYEAIFVPEGLPAPPKSIINQPELQVRTKMTGGGGNRYCVNERNAPHSQRQRI